MSRFHRLAAVLSILLTALVAGAWVIKDTTSPVSFFTGSNSTPTVSAAADGTVTLGPASSSVTHAINGGLSVTSGLSVTGNVATPLTVSATSGATLLDVVNTGSTTSDIAMHRLRTTSATGGRSLVQFATRSTGTVWVTGVETTDNFFIARNGTADFASGAALQISPSGTMTYGAGFTSNGAHAFFGPTNANTSASNIFTWGANTGGGTGYSGLLGMDATGIKIGHDSAIRDIEFVSGNSFTTRLTIGSTGLVTIAQANGGGNVPHACVTTTHTSGAGASSDSVTCGAASKLMGGGCSTSPAVDLGQMSPSGGNPPTSWNCSTTAATTTITSYAVCCVY